MPRPRKVNEDAFFLDERKQIRFCETCLGCRKECKQSFRAVVIACRRREPVNKKKRTEKG